MERPAIRVVLADDHPIVRESLKRLLSLEDDLLVVGEASDGQELLNLIEEATPDIVVLDLHMPNMDGLTTLAALRELASRPRVIVLTASEDKSEFVQAMKLGCSGIVLKQTAPELIVKSIRKVHNGEIWLDSHITATFGNPIEYRPELVSRWSQRREEEERSPLTQRERQIVVLVAQGYRNREIADKTALAEQTVKNHLHSIFDKLGVTDRLELALYVVHHRLHLSETA